MNSLDYASSDEEEKKVVFHIEIPEKTEIPKKPVIQEKKGLFDLLPKPAQALGSGGESTRIKIPSLKRKAEVVDKVAKDPKVEEEVDLFSISSIQKKPTGVARNHSTLVINPGLEEQVLEYYEEAPDVILEAEKPVEEIVYKEINQKDQIGDAYRINRDKQVTTEDVHNPFKNLPKVLNQGKGVGPRTLLSMAYDAAEKFSEKEEEMRQRRQTQRDVRKKYGF